jgi:hypothetical protein
VKAMLSEILDKKVVGESSALQRRGCGGQSVESARGNTEGTYVRHSARFAFAASTTWAPARTRSSPSNYYPISAAALFRTSRISQVQRSTFDVQHICQIS